MIDFINKEQDYLKEKDKLKLIFCDNLDLSQNSFVLGFNMFLAFEFDKVYTEKFYSGLLCFLDSINSKDFTFYTLSPNAQEYFATYFSKYSIGKIPIKTSYDEYMEFLTRDPGDSPADALLYNAETIAIYSDGAQWGIIGSKDLEIAIIGFKENTIKNKIISFFDEDYFTDIKTRIKEIENNLTIDQKRTNMYLQIEKKYSSNK